MSKLRPTHWREVERVVIKCGFVWHRTKGSHGVYVRSGSAMHVVIKQQGDIPVGTLSSIIKQLQIEKREFISLLERSRN